MGGRADNSNGVQIIGSGVAGAASNGNGVQIILGRVAGANSNSGSGLQIITGGVSGANSRGGWQKVNGGVTSSGGSQGFGNLKNKYTRAIQDLESARNQGSGSGQSRELINRALQILESGLREIDNF